MGFPLCILNVSCSLLLLLAFFAVIIAGAPYPVLPSLSSLDKAANQSVSASIDSVSFKVPCTECLASGDDAVLDFEIQYPYISSATDLCTVPLVLNGQSVAAGNDTTQAHYSLHTPSSDWSVDLSVQTFCYTPGQDDSDPPERVFFFNIDKVDDTKPPKPHSFTAVLLQAETAQVLVNANADNRTNCAAALSSVVDETSSLFTELERSPKPLDDSQKGDERDHALRLRLYQQATSLLELNEQCRKSTRDQIKDCHGSLSCVARIMCQRIHDETVAHIKKIQASLHESAMVSKQRHDQYIAADKSDQWDFNVTAIESVVPDHSQQTEDKNDQDPNNPLILALEILAAAIGLSALFRLIRSRCCSLRHRVERLADREERKRARHFRCLARREAMRKKWVSLKGKFRLPSRNGDYEEKRALILEAAGQSVEDVAGSSSSSSSSSAATGEMQDALGDLQRAHDMVTAMVARRDDPRRSFDAKSRASSSLPSYTAEKLPDYSSADETDDAAARAFEYYPSSVAPPGSVNTATTPDSSIVVTPRCSRETLRTGTGTEFSRDAGDM